MKAVTIINPGILKSKQTKNKLHNNKEGNKKSA